ncbi:MAG TPA: peptidoglycan recognition family protein [Chloroflexota bacterium]
MPRLPVFRSLLLIVALIAAGFAGWPAGADLTNASGEQFSLLRAFASAAREFGVPEPVLLSVSYHLSLWENHDGRPSTSGGYGPMDLTHADRVMDITTRGRAVIRLVRHDPSLRTLDLAARLLKVPSNVLERNATQNIRGGAALLAHDAMQTTSSRPRRLADWYGAVARYSGSPYAPAAAAFADSVYRTIGTGVARITATGQRVSLPAQHVSPNTRTATLLPLIRSAQTRAACPATIACQYVPAAYHVNNPRNPQDYGNYDVANRPKDGLAIRYIVIHDTEGSYAGAISSFQDPARYASANYVIRASDGLVTQMVANKDIAWHAGNYYVNIHAIGIEHEGVAIQGATWYTEQFYETSAALVRYLAHTYHIPIDVAHIAGHDGVPGDTPAGQSAEHWDPGPFWDWQHYMQLLGEPAPTAVVPAPLVTDPSIVTITPTFATNRPPVRYCPSATTCDLVAAQPANFVYLHTAPSASAPLVGDPALHSSPAAGTTQAPDWGDKAITGQQFVRVARQGRWDAIDYGGVKAWLDDPASKPTTVLSSGWVVTPRGSAPIKVYGCACPERSAYPHFIHHPQKITPLQYSIPPGQEYVATGPITASYYWTPTQSQHAVVIGKTVYYQISFNHRFAFVLAGQVRVTSITAPTPTPEPTASPTPTATASPTPSEREIASPTPTPSSIP